MTVEYTTEIEEQILSHLDGWVIKTITDDDSDSAETVETSVTVETTNDSNGSTTPIITDTGEVQPFITDINEYADNPNKKVTSAEVQRFYGEALDKSYVYCNRLNVEDLTSTEEGLFIKGVCFLTASDLWNKYNIRVNNEDLEDTYIQSYGGLLYKQALNILNSFINQRITNLTSLKKKQNEQNSIWLI